VKIPLGLCLSLVTLLGCAEGPATEGPGPEGDRSVSAAATARGPEPAVVARVNGVAITEIDLDLKLKSDNHEAAPGPERRKVALEQLVTREILAQKALAQGLDRDPKYLEGQRVRAAQMAAYERQELAELLLRREGDKRGVPTEADARAYFDQYGSRVRSRVHVLQILRRTEAAIVEVLLKKSLAALKETGLRRLVVAGGVGANRELRRQLNAACAGKGVRVHYPELHLCTDNGAMIAMAAAMRLQTGVQQPDRSYAFDVKPRWPLDALELS